ncbi:MAG: glycosyltransferase family 2 protein, partial [Candidatus Shapirobacteria bacterium]|nr:glycosyltransferase family 2 protein [Candidatus Shapirobacteria bacterium]
MTKLPPKNPVDLSVIILNYNSAKYLSKCLQSIKKSNFKPYNIEFIIIDNASTDNSFSSVKNINLPNSKFINSPGNIGFSAGNNFGLKFISNPKYVLFLNPDTVIKPNTLSGMVKYLDLHPEVDAATCDVILALTGKTQLECHRGFPTPFNTFWHFFGFGLPKLFPKSRFFNGYFLGYLDYTKPQLIDCCVGAFLMLKKAVGDTIGWWNEKYFFYGEDLDFCYKLKQNNYQLNFIPQFKITHFQGISSGIKRTQSTASR